MAITEEARGGNLSTGYGGAMMKIAFISLLEDVSIPSLRYLSAYLRAKGHDTVLILLPQTFTDRTLSESDSFLYPYPDKVLEQVAEICSMFDLVGISMMTCHFDNAVHVTNFLRKRLHVPIIWGGIHPTLRPAECLEYADMVCIGEGEISLCQLASEMSNGRPWESLSIPGIYKCNDNQPLSVLPSPIIQNLDELPLPDYDLDHQFVLYKGNMVRFNNGLLTTCLHYSYRTLFSRGCPYACTYCCNNAIRKLHGHKLPMRWRSVSNRINELEAAMELMPQLKQIFLADEAFLSQPTKQIESFAASYRKEIGLPLSLLATPRSVSESKLRPLAKAGLCNIGIGIQSASKRIVRDLYSRPESSGEVLSASACIKQVARETKKQVSGRYDFILDNPWETEQDIEASIRLCMKLKKPYGLALFSLTFYPETELYIKARNEGIITDDLNQVYRRSQLVPNRNYLNGVFAVLSANAPGWVVSLLLWKHIPRLSLVWLPYLVASIFRTVKLFRQFLGYVARNDWSLIRFLLGEKMLKLLVKLKKGRASDRRPRFCGAPGESCP